jgi:hypothetical protein
MMCNKHHHVFRMQKIHACIHTQTKVCILTGGPLLIVMGTSTYTEPKETPGRALLKTMENCADSKSGDPGSLCTLYVCTDYVCMYVCIHACTRALENLWKILHICIYMCVKILHICIYVCMHRAAEHCRQLCGFGVR